MEGDAYRQELERVAEQLLIQSGHPPAALRDPAGAIRREADRIESAVKRWADGVADEMARERIHGSDPGPFVGIRNAAPTPLERARPKWRMR